MTITNLGKVADRLGALLAAECKDYRLLLILLRFIIRHAINVMNDFSDECRALKRERMILEKQGFKVPFLDMRIEKIEAGVKALHDIIVDDGRFVIVCLDEWQKAGATLKDLCDLIGRPYHVVTKSIRDEDLTDDLSGLMTVYGLDYQSNGSGFYELTQDGPFAHATRECLLDQVLNTEHGRQAARNALISVFPELWDKRMYETVDGEGNHVLVDKDGETVAVLDEGGGRQ